MQVFLYASCKIKVDVYKLDALYLSTNYAKNTRMVNWNTVSDHRCCIYGYRLCKWSSASGDAVAADVNRNAAGSTEQSEVMKWSQCEWWYF